MSTMALSLANEADVFTKVCDIPAPRLSCDSFDSFDADSACTTMTPELSDADDLSVDTDDNDIDELSDSNDKLNASSYTVAEQVESDGVRALDTCPIVWVLSSTPSYSMSLAANTKVIEVSSLMASLPRHLQTIHEAIDEDEHAVRHSAPPQVDSRVPMKVFATPIASKGKKAKCRVPRSINDEPLKKRPLFPDSELPVLSDPFEPITIKPSRIQEDSFSNFLLGLIQPEVDVTTPSPAADSDTQLPAKVVPSFTVSKGRSTKCKSAPSFQDEPLQKRPLLPDLLEGPLNLFEPYRIKVNVDSQEDSFSEFLRSVMLHSDAIL